MSNKPYTDKDYQGDLNLLYAERHVMCLALERAKGQIKQASTFIKISERTFHRKMVLHQLHHYRDEVLSEQYMTR